MGRLTVTVVTAANLPSAFLLLRCSLASLVEVLGGPRASPLCSALESGLEWAIPLAWEAGVLEPQPPTHFSALTSI